MNRFIAHTLSVIVLLLGTAGFVAAQEGPPCGTGEWSYTKTGTLLLPTGPVPYAAVGKFSVNANGVLSGSQYSSTGGAVGRNVLAGLVTWQPDGSSLATVEVYDESGTTLLRTAVMSSFAVDNCRETRSLVTRLTLGNGVVVPQVITAVARKVENNFGR